MAKTVRSATLSTPKSGLNFYYSAFLRSKKLNCSESSIKIYKTIGEKQLIPALDLMGIERFEDVQPEHIRSILEDYDSDHNKGVVDFIYRHIKAFFRWYWEEYDIQGRCPIDTVQIKRYVRLRRRGSRGKR